jgi:hypothetical protein
VAFHWHIVCKCMRIMPVISDALELLTAQHEQIDSLLDLVAALHDPDALAELADTIAQHVSVEQRLLYPQRALQLPRDIYDELLAEHDELRRVLAELVWRGVDDDDFVAELANLRVLLDGHVAYQEDELFTRAAAAMSVSQLHGLCREMTQSTDAEALPRALALAS